MKYIDIRFRPLTGINFNKPAKCTLNTGSLRFRPLTRINFNVSESVIASNFQRFPSPLGDKFQLGRCWVFCALCRVSVPSRG